MDLGIRGRTALVCASTAGLGEAAARALAAEGARVAICGRRGGLAASIAAELPDAVGIEVDLIAEDGPRTLVARTLDAFGQVDILVTNSPGPPPGDSVDLTDRDIVAAVESLVLPHQRLVSLLLPGMRERGWGRILAIASVGVAAPIPGLAASNLGRAALANYLKTLSAEVARDGVTVNLVLPGRIATARTVQMNTFRANREGVSVQEFAARAQAAIPVGRFGDPAEFGALAAFLCSQQASYMTGTAVRCDGGAVPTL